MTHQGAAVQMPHVGPAVSKRWVQRVEAMEELVDRLFRQRVESDIDWRAKKLKDCIDNAEGKVNEGLGHVCNQLQLSLSERQARRLFKESLGISMKDYARKSRLACAAKRLQVADEPIKVIATDAGYRTHFGFCKAFSDMFRMTPVEFRTFSRRFSALT